MSERRRAATPPPGAWAAPGPPRWPSALAAVLLVCSLLALHLTPASAPLAGERKVVATAVEGDAAAATPGTTVAALGRPEPVPGTGFCAADQAGVRGKLCRILSGLLVRMEPLPEGRGTVRLSRPSGVYYDGEFVTVAVEVPPEVPSAYLRVVYLDESGEVLHMLPNLDAAGTAVRAGQRILVGAPEKDRRRGLRDFRVTAPYGRGMILAMLSERPLDRLGRGETESMGSFLSALETALRSANSRRAPIRFASAAIETRPR